MAVRGTNESEVGKAHRGRRLGGLRWCSGRRGVAAILAGVVLSLAGFVLCSGRVARLAWGASAGGSGVYSTKMDSRRQVRSLYELLSLSESELEQVDIALMNLICAQGLSGAERLDIDDCLAQIDQWVRLIRKDTEARTDTFYFNPGRYDNSLNLFKVANMILTLKNDIGVDYNLEIMKKTEFHDSRDFFIHGCLIGKTEGGCISIPTLCVAVGRRLGYPLKLVLTREHVFFRWDDGKEVFNMEACCPGCDTHPDDHYKKWPHVLQEIEIRMNVYLKPLTPAEELAVFLQTRGHCLYDNGNAAEAMIMYAYSHKLMPNSLDMLAHVRKAFGSELRPFHEIKAEIDRRNRN